MGKNTDRKIAPADLAWKQAGLNGQAGVQELAGNATLLYYMSEEAQERKTAYAEKRKPDFKKFLRVS